MSIDTVTAAAQRLLEDDLMDESLTVVWHAGEPLVVPVSFYDDAIDAISKTLGTDRAIAHSMQTNGTLIDDDWCRLFVKHGIRVGVSIDGPAQLHDRHRRTRSGKGTHSAVLQGMDCLRAHGVPFHAIAVVTDATFECVDEFFRFFEQQGVHELGCNFDEAEGSHLRSSLEGHESAHAAFMSKMLEKSIDSHGVVRVRELDNALRLISEGSPTYRWRGGTYPANAQTTPFALISVRWNGDFSTFSPELLGQSAPDYGDFIFGNVNDGGYLQASGTESFTNVWQSILEGTKACRDSCAYFAYCGGGAPANKLYENGSLASTESLYCRTMVKRPFDAVLQKIENGLGSSYVRGNQ